MRGFWTGYLQVARRGRREAEFSEPKGWYHAVFRGKSKQAKWGESTRKSAFPEGHEWGTACLKLENDQLFSLRGVIAGVESGPKLLICCFCVPLTQYIGAWLHHWITSKHVVLTFLMPISANLMDSCYMQIPVFFKTRMNRTWTLTLKKSIWQKWQNLDRQFVSVSEGRGSQT